MVILVDENTKVVCQGLTGTYSVPCWVKAFLLFERLEPLDTMR